MYEIEYIDIEKNKEYEDIIRETIKKCFENEKIENSKLYICITITNNENIQKMNKKYRNIDKKTDVLSFPMFEKEEIPKAVESQNEDILGDIVISIPQIILQAEEYGHSIKRELAYMIVHGFYHLMGYDHIEEEDKNKMRKKEEEVLGTIAQRK